MPENIWCVGAAVGTIAECSWAVKTVKSPTLELQQYHYLDLHCHEDSCFKQFNPNKPAKSGT